MEMCGGQTHSIVRYGIDRLLPAEIELVHGPGCPVCVTSLEMIDRAHAIAARPDVIFCSFGDMLRVPGIERRSARGCEARGGGRARRLLAARCPGDGARQPGPAGGLLRHRLRDDGAGQRDGGLPGQGSRASATSRCWSRTCWCRRRSRRSCSRRQPRSGLSRTRPRLRGHGFSRVRGAGRALSACPSSSPASSPSICCKGS